MIKGGAELIFGNRDIGIFVCEHSEDKNHVAVFFNSIEPVEKGTNPQWDPHEAKVAMIFTKEESIDVLIDGLIKAKNLLSELKGGERR